VGGTRQHLDDWLKAWVDIETSAPAITDRELKRGERA
jgi:hypothetical protein